MNNGIQSWHDMVHAGAHSALQPQLMNQDLGKGTHVVLVVTKRLRNTTGRTDQLIRPNLQQWNVSDTADKHRRRDRFK